MSDLPIEKQLVHHQFCQKVERIKDPNIIRKMLEDLHLSYLSDQAMMVKLAKQEFMGEKL